MFIITQNKQPEKRTARIPYGIRAILFGSRQKSVQKLRSKKNENHEAIILGGIHHLIIIVLNNY